ncbi:uncharacterized protein LOC6585768 isoform X2 [Drosophila mojavensis]|uniref:Uncharacterized protein, isoform B n=2 Tax=Drosophila mojavensis TaxID=7230 RepID=B4L790_DROMO|nr:uncharacterized protein LOC6585768 isoform X2 [Drosophila mojavensis]XP_015016157.1 uncharacterized protein LOC6585768 isoform X2 [Drosophila mojavensis]XP_015016158.1 uncharacterized protein LOC6585768 isoform X2 [Drosophila mojavensis]XP_015016159.1 uncharacterized protein LOC6585768 isoform X2 [Drosophila mojavensis]EDW10884.2 uncharacterized protein Dmoj_GI14077, isoform E [Drosophila mojavensis]KRG07216.1 uncharacterized protein Dmoj_GI14077, isoform B [Drosophila mojavensis]KRG07217.
MAGKERHQAVLNIKLSKSKKSKLRCTQQPIKTANNPNCNTQQTSAENSLLKNCQIRQANNNIVAMLTLFICNSQLIFRKNFKMFIALLVTFSLICTSQSILLDEQVGSAVISNNTSYRTSGKSISSNNTAGRSSVAVNGYLDKLDNLERSVAAVLIKVAYGTTSTTKRSIPDNSYILGLTTVATPLLTTLRYQAANQAQHNGGRHRNYELDLERDHALPTSAPNADILKSNNNPTYPNPNRHHSSSSHDRDRHRHTMQYNSTPMPSIPNLLKKISGQPTIPMYPGDIPSYSPPSRAFFTPPLPPEYQNPFADKPTLRGTNNEGLISNTVPFNNRRPIPPPSLMPGHERIPFRPPDLAASHGNGDGNSNHNTNDSYFASSVEPKKPLVATSIEGALDIAGDRKKALNTPARNGNDAGAVESSDPNAKNRKTQDVGISNSKENSNKRQEVLPNIRRILGSNGKKGDIPAVLLRHVTQRPMVPYHQPPASPIVSVDNVETANGNGNISSMTDDGTSSAASPNINKSKQSSGQLDYNNSAAARDSFGNNASQTTVTTLSASTSIGEAAATSFTSASATTNPKPTLKSISAAGKSGQDAGVIGVTAREGDAVGAAAAAAASANTTWTWAWNIHIYLSVVLFTILAVYSLYKLVTYNKLTHLFAQSYFVYIQLILITICIMRIIYLCVDAYNIHGTFQIFAAELLLNLPSTFLTVAFAVLILFLFLKSLNHKNNRYSALVRPLTVVVGCGVHVGLCITLHYVESYTLQNHHMYYQQQQQHQYFRRQQQQQHQQLHSQSPFSGSPSTSLANSPPPRVLSLICQIIYIFICFSLGLLYLYLYRILKRILRSKSQNYIHGYQNLSYAIHITIATALLFVLLAALQIFGAICISATRPLMSQANIVEIDWMQWGYQFSLRLIEIAIITLISWVTGLKTSQGSNVNAAISLNSDVRMAGQASGGFGANATGSVIREKHAVAAPAHHNSHSNVANFFLPCTSSSSQEQFETDYPAICNANTNLHTYTMRTGKLIYDDSYALNSLAGPSAASPSGGGTEYQLQEPMYQRPYDTGSINHNITAEYGQQSSRYHHINHNHQNMRAHEPASYMSADYMTDTTTDHYENPNFDLRTNSTGAVGVVGVAAMQKQAKNTVSSGSASGSASGSGSSGTSGTSQQQMLLLQSDSCYSEPLQENSSYEFNNFERPVFKEKSIDSSPHPTDECWPERVKEGRKITKSRDRKHNSKLDTTTENPERRSSNSTNSCSSSNGIRYTNYNSYESGSHYNGVRKSGTLNNIDTCSTMLAGQIGGISIASGPGPGPGPGRAIAVMPSIKRVNGAQTLAHNERSHYFQRSGRNMSTINNRTLPLNEFELAPSVCNELALKQHQIKQQQKPHQHPQHHYNHNNSEEEDEEDEDIISGSNVECTNLISNSEHGYCIASDNSITTRKSPHLHVQSIHQHLAHNSLQEHSVTCSPDLKANVSKTSGDAESQSCTSDSMIVADQGFLRFRGGNEEQVELGHGKPTNEVNQPSRSVSLICSSVNGINC